MNGPDKQTIRKWIKIVTIVMAILMLRVWENVKSQGYERELKVLHLEADRLTYENGRLLVQIHQYESPSNLEALAKKQYSMIPLDPSHRIGIQP